MRCYSNILNQIKKSAWLVFFTINETFKNYSTNVFLKLQPQQCLRKQNKRN